MYTPGTDSLSWNEGLVLIARITLIQECNIKALTVNAIAWF
jgi:hypothetical protein